MAAQLERSRPRWCPGCGDFSVYESLKAAIAELGLRPEEVVLVCGIGCATFIWSYLNTNSLKTIHGRVLPAATGIKLVKPELKVIGVSGDGDAYSIGCNHLVHTARRNVEVTYIVIDNGVFGNTRGQPSPTTPLGAQTKLTPSGWPERPLEPLLLAIVSGATFVAQGFAGDPKGLKDQLKEALSHRGFSLINIISFCPTFNPSRTVKDLRERIVYLDEIGFDRESRSDALRTILSIRESGKYPVGIALKIREPTYSELLNTSGGRSAEAEQQAIERIALRDLGLRISFRPRN